MPKSSLLAAIMLLWPTAVLGAGVAAAVESGVVFAGYNDVRIPPDSGTEFSLTDDLESNPRAYIRFQGMVHLGRRHELSLLIAPLRLHADGVAQRAITYQGETFAAGTPLEATYRFDSYRIGYLYTFSAGSRWDFGLGFTAKIRDAEISLVGGGQRAEKVNTGFVPLIGFRARYALRSGLHALLAGEALASPGGQGRAEDVFAGVVVRATRGVSVRAGYRVLEGGADVDEVYNFALLHYAALAVRIAL
ncbi:MAG: hypothetical protein GF355_03965 [Candidatus Eisenbacteria bacterium]|nr:hypothetical protein [Candidatus Eisenbacteria bacterium]